MATAMMKPIMQKETMMGVTAVVLMETQTIAPTASATNWSALLK